MYKRTVLSGLVVRTSGMVRVMFMSGAFSLLPTDATAAGRSGRALRTFRRADE